MRVQLIQSGRRTGSDSEGAVAIIVAISLVVLLGISAFAVDFGLAYSNKRQLQTATDAAVVAAAATYADDDGDCTTLTDLSTAFGLDRRDDAQEAAVQLMHDNHAEAVSVPADFQVQCSATGGVAVSWTSADSTDVGLGGVFGVDEIDASRTATASLEVPASVGVGLRPFAMCSFDLPSGDDTMPTEVRKIGGVTSGSDYQPGCPEPSGNWWTINCPEDVGSNSDAVIRDSIADGCEYPVQIVDNPSPAPPSDVGLEAACPPMNPPDPDVAEDCLEGNPGSVTKSQADEWKVLVDRKETVIIPAFCGEPTCSPEPAIVDAGGANAAYPIHAFVGMRVCGYHFGNQQYQVSDGICANNPSMLTTMDGDSQSYYLLVVYDRVLLSGTLNPSGCALGDADCDHGLRQVFLVE